MSYKPSTGMKPNVELTAERYAELTAAEDTLNDMLQEDEHGQRVLQGLLENLGVLMFGGYVAIEEKLAITKQSFDDSLKQHTGLV